MAAATNGMIAWQDACSDSREVALMGILKPRKNYATWNRLQLGRCVGVRLPAKRRCQSAIAESGTIIGRIVVDAKPTDDIA